MTEKLKYLPSIVMSISFLVHNYLTNMDFEPRRKKSDKAKEKYDRNGSYTNKHVRINERLLERKNTSTIPPTSTKK